MARTGRPRKPTEQHKAQGTYRADRHGEAAGDLPYEPGIPVPPKGMRLKYRKVWDELTGQMADAGILCVADASTVEGAVSALVRAREARQKIDKDGAYITSKANGVTAHPAVGVERQAMQQALTFLRELGLTPSSRAGFAKRAADKEPGHHAPGGKVPAADPLAKMAHDVGQVQLSVVAD